MEMREYQFKDALTQVTTPQLVFDNAHRIYDYLVELFNNPMASDSVLREWAFQYSTENLGIKYDAIYNKWLGQNDNLKELEIVAKSIEFFKVDKEEDYYELGKELTDQEITYLVMETDSGYFPTSQEHDNIEKALAELNELKASTK